MSVAHLWRVLCFAAWWLDMHYMRQSVHSPGFCSDRNPTATELCRQGCMAASQLVGLHLLRSAMLHFPDGSSTLLQDLHGGEDASQQLLGLDQVDQILLHRLSESPPDDYPQYPFHYLLACMERLRTERMDLDLKDPTTEQQLSEALAECRKTLVNFAVMSLVSGDVIAQVSANLLGRLVATWFVPAISHQHQSSSNASHESIISLPSVSLPAGDWNACLILGCVGGHWKCLASPHDKLISFAI